jgi:hypothetical protein
MLLVLDKCIVILMNKRRSKWYSLACFGPKRHYRKDGSCKHTDRMLKCVKPEALPRVRVDGFGGKAKAADARRALES